MIQLPNLDTFGISPNLGFLSNQRPLSSFSNPCFAQLDELATDLPILITTGSLRTKLDSLPYLDPIHLSSEGEYRRAYVVLGFLIHAYVWGGSRDNGPLGSIPSQLAEPFLAVCERLGMEPVLSYAGLCLWNWAPKDGTAYCPSGFFELHDLQPLGSFTGGRGEAAFYHVPVLVEAEGGPLIPLLLEAVAATERSDADQVTKALTRSAEIIERMKLHLPKLYTTLDAGMFYHELRPFLSGGKGMEDKGLPRGFVFQRRDGSEQEVQCIGGSAAQSSLFQFLDVVLGIQHEPMGRDSETLFQTMRAYMPGKHREFLEAVSTLPSIRPYVQQNPSNDTLHDAYNECIKQLRQWRGSHIAIVSKYIVRPARLSTGANRDTATDDIEQASLENDKGSSLQGTGGSALIPFLRQSKDETAGV
ncbi:indoleamine 2,3-dioxygenase domain-containing protein [Sarocladium implicatum]|nr:indoleamine 2,3-dioxygenase domain-containing protein [Sarocladium implicatum]